MSELVALLFDVDGTLADTERDGHRVAFNAAFRDAGIDWDWDEPLYGELLAVTGGKERMHYYLDRYRPNWPRPQDLDELIARLHEEKTVHYTQMLAEGRVSLRPGVKRLLEEARAAGLRLAVATTTTPANVTALLRHGLAPDGVEWFAVIAAGDIVPEKKPAPDIYHWALEQLGLRPDQCLAFEDSENGIRSSLGAGLATLVTINGYTQAQDFDGAELVLDHLGEPDLPFTVLAGDAGGATYVDVPLLRRVHARALARA
jgi:HAD superfamily hydrolase (TIGR01509 family)